MKVTTERLPKSVIALDIELDQQQVDKGLDRAARKLAQQFSIPGFRPGKAPRFIVENYLGRARVMEEASDELINKAFQDALKQENITPVGKPNLENVEEQPFRFRVTVPVEPAVELPDYRAYQLPYEREPVAEETVQKLLDAQREQHVVLRELEEMRPAQPGDMVTVVMASDLDEDEDDEDDLDEDEEGDVPEGAFADEVALEDDADDEDDEDEDEVPEGAFADEVVLEDDAATEDDEDEDDAGDEDDEVPAGAFADEVALEDDTEIEAGADEDDEDDLDDVDDEDDEDEETIALVEGRVRPEIYQALIGAQPGETRTVTIHYGEDEEGEELRGRDVTYTITVKNVQERLLPEWEELPTLAEFEGDIDAMRTNARERLERAADERARRALLDTFVERAMADTTIDLPDAMIEERADELFHGQAAQFARYGLTEEQYLMAIGKSHDEAVAELREPAEQDVRRQLILREFIRREGLQLNDQDIADEIEHFLQDYDASRREEMRPLVENPNMRTMLASSALDRKLRDRLVEIASGGRETGALPAPQTGRSRVYASGARIERTPRDISIAGSDGSGEPAPAIETTGAVGELEETRTDEVDMVKEESVS